MHEHTAHTRPPLKRAIACLFLLLIFALPAALPAGANSPAPANTLPVTLLGELPAGAAYADLLVALPASDELYTPLNEDNAAARGWDADTPAVSYAEDGFVSFTFHFRGARLTEPLAETEGYPVYFADWDSDHWKQVEEHCPRLKIALLDKEGGRLQVSPEVNIAPNRPGYLSGLWYDAGENTAGLYWYEGMAGAAKRALPGFVRIVFSIAAEVLIALAFRLKGVWKVGLVNLGTQIALTIFMALAPWSYTACLLVGEAAVYLLEFALYLPLYRGVSRRRLALYTLTANTFTLLAGLLLNQVNWFLP